jgi:hypothetical protein
MKLSDVKIVQKKTLTREKYRNDLGGHARCKDSITIKKIKIFVGEKEKEE